MLWLDALSFRPSGVVASPLESPERRPCSLKPRKLPHPLEFPGLFFPLLESLFPAFGIPEVWQHFFTLFHLCPLQAISISAEMVDQIHKSHASSFQGCLAKPLVCSSEHAFSFLADNLGTSQIFKFWFLFAEQLPQSISLLLHFTVSSKEKPGHAFRTLLRNLVS